MNTNAKYLRVTVHDNDFRVSLMLIGELIYTTFCIHGEYPTEEELPILKESIKHLWYGAHMTEVSVRWSKETSATLGWFEPHLEFVDYLDIPDWDNGESIYIPLFYDAEVLER